MRQILIVILIAITLVGYIAYQKQTKQFPPIKACTQDSKICSDGSYVSRIPPNCEFAPCPSPSITPSPSCTEFKPIIKPSSNKGWDIFTGKAMNNSCNQSFSIEYPDSWQNDGYSLYPFGKTGSNQDPIISLASGGHGWWNDVTITEKNFPAGTASYSWGKPEDQNYFVGFATIEQKGHYFTAEAGYIPVDKESEIQKLFNQILSTFKFE